MSNRTAVVIGATGLVGKELVNHLLEGDAYGKVTVIARKPLLVENEKLHQILEDNFSKLGKYTAELDANDYFCAIGTTRKKTPSKRAYFKIDVAYPVMLAKIAQQQPSFENYLVVSSYGSNANSPLFYNMIKGKLEQELEKLNLKSLKIFKPSLLKGDREEERTGESLGLWLTKLLSIFTIGKKKKQWSTSGEDLAKAMILVARSSHTGLEKYTPYDIKKISEDWL